jgi:predicted nucleic acid-binding protein
VIAAVVDSSAWIRAFGGSSSVEQDTKAALVGGELALCEPVRLEILRGARDGAEAASLDNQLESLLTLHTDQAAWRLARRTLVQLAHLPGGRHRGPSLVDVLVAATAERHGVAVLHDDDDFELIAQVTGQTVLRLAA